jgi:hypothetical protein
MKLPFTWMLVVLFLAGSPSPGRADTTEAPPPSPTAPARETFGGQVVLGDVIGAIGSLGIVSATGRATGLLLYPVAAPTIHLIHRDGTGALASLILHLGAPVAGAFLGSALSSSDCHASDEDTCALGGFLVGGLFGLATATTVDAVWLARTTPTTPAQQSRRSIATPTLAIAPRGGLVLGVAGRL